MAEYSIHGVDLLSNFVQYDINSYGWPLSRSDAFDLLDFLVTRGYIDASSARINARDYWDADIPDPRP